MAIRSCKIISTGKYLPKRQVLSESLDQTLGKAANWAYSKSGIKGRFYATNTEGNESTSDMAVMAIYEALEKANMKLEDIDCIVSASGIPQQAIPSSASIIKSALGMSGNTIPVFDINATCLSFLTALDVVSYMIDSNRFNNVIIVSSDISSVGLDFQNQPEVAIMFGDGACAAIISKSDGGSKILSSDMMTITEGVNLCQLRAGGSLRGRHSPVPANDDDYYFRMQGPETYKLVAKHVTKFITGVLEKANLTTADIDMVIPHQASYLGLKHFQKTMRIPDEKIMYILEDHGNQIAASLPTALHEAVKQKRIKRGDKILLCGSGAGVSIGAIVLEY